MAKQTIAVSKRVIFIWYYMVSKRPLRADEEEQVLRTIAAVETYCLMRKASVLIRNL